MPCTKECHFRTGGDPRQLADYVRLRDEMNKLTHPARPDVNWSQAETLCLSLFDNNGVELQTAAWYTLARTQLAGLYGLNEGLAVLTVLISHQWGSLWPHPVPVRVAILNGLSKRLQQMLRTLMLTSADLSQLYRAERLLSDVGDILQRLDLKYPIGTEALFRQLHASTVQLENSSSSDRTDTLPKRSGHTGPRVTENPVILRDGDFSQESVPGVEVLTEYPAPARPWKAFSAGMLTMLVVATTAVWGWHFLHQPDPLQTQLMASLSPRPATLTITQLQALQQKTLSPDAVISQTRQQLSRLAGLQPDWSIAYGNQLVQQIQALWPEQSESLAQQWQQQLNASELSAEQLNGWHQGMEQLQALTNISA